MKKNRKEKTIAKRLFREGMMAAAAIILLCAQWASAQSISIQLEVPERIMAPGDAVEIRGTYTTPHSWDDGQRLTRNAQGLWTMTLVPQNHIFEYKYVIVRSNGQLEWESGGNRQYDGAEQPNDVIRGFEGEFLARSATVEFRLNLEGMTVNGYPVQQAAVMGERGRLSWELPDGATLMIHTEGGLWAASVTFPEGMPVDVPFKFAWQADGVWHWEPLPGHIDHLLMLDPNARSVTAAYRYNPETGRVEPESGSGASLDDYSQAAGIYGSSRRYGYMRAIELIESGNFAAARQEYEGHRRYYEPVEIDDFDFIWAEKLAGQGQLDQALEFARRQLEEEANPWRRAYFRYLKGELLLNGGQYEQAIVYLEQALEEAPESDEERLIEGYSHLALAISYGSHPDAEQRGRARGYLLALALRHPDEQMQRMALQKLADASRAEGDERGLERALERLTQTGSPVQRARSRVDRLEYRMEHVPPDSAALELQWLEGTIADEALQQRVQLLKAGHLISLGRRGEAEQILQQVQARSEFPAASGRAKARLNDLQNNRGGN